MVCIGVLCWFYAPQLLEKLEQLRAFGYSVAAFASALCIGISISPFDAETIAISSLNEIILARTKNVLLYSFVFTHMIFFVLNGYYFELLLILYFAFSCFAASPYIATTRSYSGFI